MIHLPADVLQRALGPALDALCACARPGDHFRAVATILPEQGTVTTAVPDDPAVDGCLSRLDAGRFESFSLGGSDCIDCGARHASRPNRPTRLVSGRADLDAGPGETPGGSRISYPLRVAWQIGHKP